MVTCACVRILALIGHNTIIIPKIFQVFMVLVWQKNSSVFLFCKNVRGFWITMIITLITLIPMHCSWYFFPHKFSVFWIQKPINHHKSYQWSHKSYQHNHKSSPIKMKKWLLYTLIYYFFYREFTSNAILGQWTSLP